MHQNRPRPDLCADARFDFLIAQMQKPAVKPEGIEQRLRVLLRAAMDEAAASGLRLYTP